MRQGMSDVFYIYTLQQQIQELCKLHLNWWAASSQKAKSLLLMYDIPLYACVPTPCNHSNLGLLLTLAGNHTYTAWRKTTYWGNRAGWDNFWYQQGLLLFCHCFFFSFDNGIFAAKIILLYLKGNMAIFCQKKLRKWTQGIPSSKRATLSLRY